MNQTLLINSGHRDTNIITMNSSKAYLSSKLVCKESISYHSKIPFLKTHGGVKARMLSDTMKCDTRLDIS